MIAPTGRSDMFGDRPGSVGGNRGDADVKVERGHSADVEGERGYRSVNEQSNESMNPPGATPASSADASLQGAAPAQAGAGRGDRSESNKSEAAKTEDGRSESARSEHAKIDGAGVNNEGANSEHARSEGASAESDTPEVKTDTQEPDPPADDPKARAAEYLALAQRTQADFENFRKRVARDAAQGETRGIGKLTKELLPALDHFEIALRKVNSDGGELDEIMKGFRLVHDEFIGALERVGVKRFSPEGEVFDPNEHEAMAQQPSENAESGTIIEVYQQGYRIEGSILRPARVVVAE